MKRVDIGRSDPLGRSRWCPPCRGDVGRICPQQTQTRQPSWPLGVLANSYALPEVRNAGVGSRLLAAIKGWAIGENLELLVVWPSEKAYPFYERAGYRRTPDPVVLRLAPPG